MLRDKRQKETDFVDVRGFSVHRQPLHTKVTHAKSRIQFFQYCFPSRICNIIFLIRRSQKNVFYIFLHFLGCGFSLKVRYFKGSQLSEEYLLQNCNVEELFRQTGELLNLATISLNSHGIRIQLLLFKGRSRVFQQKEELESSGTAPLRPFLMRVTTSGINQCVFMTY